MRIKLHLETTRVKEQNFVQISDSRWLLHFSKKKSSPDALGSITRLTAHLTSDPGVMSLNPSPAT